MTDIELAGGTVIGRAEWWEVRTGELTAPEIFFNAEQADAFSRSLRFEYDPIPPVIHVVRLSGLTVQFMGDLTVSYERQLSAARDAYESHLKQLRTENERLRLMLKSSTDNFDAYKEINPAAGDGMCVIAAAEVERLQCIADRRESMLEKLAATKKELVAANKGMQRLSGELTRLKAARAAELFLAGGDGDHRTTRQLVKAIEKCLTFPPVVLDKPDCWY